MFTYSGNIHCVTYAYIHFHIYTYIFRCLPLPTIHHGWIYKCVINMITSFIILYALIYMFYIYFRSRILVAEYYIHTIYMYISQHCHTYISKPLIIYYYFHYFMYTWLLWQHVTYTPVILIVFICQLLPIYFTSMPHSHITII